MNSFFIVIFFICIVIVILVNYINKQEKSEDGSKKTTISILIAAILIFLAISPIGALYAMLFESIFYLPGSYINSYKRNNPVECEDVIVLKNPLYDEDSTSLRGLGEYSNFGIKNDYVYRIFQPYGKVRRCVKIKSDAASFIVIDSYHAKDNNNAYVQKYLSSTNAKNWYIIQNIDSSSFVTFDNSNYAKDKNNVYFNGDIIKNANSNTFEALFTSKIKEGIRYNARDNVGLYYKGNLVRASGMDSGK